MAAGIVLVVEGGGTVTNFAGEPPDLQGRQLVASNGRIHAAMLEVLARQGAASGALSDAATRGSGPRSP
jgi:myo-inositol-1(or 4)-monophosphatase